jgi:hypothetical protein
MKIPLDCPELNQVETPTVPIGSPEAQAQCDLEYRAFADLQTARLENCQRYCDQQNKRIADLERTVHLMQLHCLLNPTKAWEIGNQVLTSL